MLTSLTLVLHNWARAEQMAQVIDKLRKQTIPLNLFVWDNHPGDLSKHCISQLDWYVASSTNVHQSSFFYMAGQAGTPFVGRMDDDLYPTDEYLLADALRLLERQAEDCIVGPYGRQAARDKPYRDGFPLRPAILTKDVRADMVRGRLMLMRRTALLRCRPEVRTPHIDLTMSFDLAGLRRHHHLVPQLFKNRLADFPEDEHGYCSQATHHEDRDKLLQEWLAQFPQAAKADGGGL